MIGHRIILASASPRRRDILHQFGLDPVIIESSFDESTVQETDPAKLVRELSAGKAAAVQPHMEPGDLLIAADTVVAIDGKILGKPADDAEAEAMIREIAGRHHDVFTGVTLLYRSKQGRMYRKNFADRTAVDVMPLTEAEIREYIESGDHRGKAGAYAIQGVFGQYVRRIRGDVYTVIGLPGARTMAGLKELLRRAGEEGPC